MTDTPEAVTLKDYDRAKSPLWVDYLKQKAERPEEKTEEKKERER